MSRQPSFNHSYKAKHPPDILLQNQEVPLIGPVLSSSISINFELIHVVVSFESNDIVKGKIKRKLYFYILSYLVSMLSREVAKLDLDTTH